MTIWLTTEEVAQRIKESKHTIAQRCASGQIPATKLGGEWRVKEDDLEAWMAPNNIKPGVRVRNTSRRRSAKSVTA